MNLRRLVSDPRPSWPVACLRIGLRLASLPYRAVITLRNLAYRRGWKRSFRSPLLTISVGNLSVGGTGKTPAVAWVANWLRQHAIRVAILSRGYGQLDSGQNDEALELELQLPDVPHLQHWDRVASARLAEEELDMQALLLDDGFQHQRLARDLDLVLIDATDSPAAQHLLPGGLLREPLSSLSRAQAVILTRCDQVSPERLEQLRQRVRRANAAIVIAQANHRPHSLGIFAADPQPLADIQGRRVLAFCGIGNPESFFQSVRDLGAQLIETRIWPDHHAYQADDVQQIAQWTMERPEAEWLLCTRKDWVKLQAVRLGRLPLAAVLVELEITEGRAELEQLLTQSTAHLLERPDPSDLATGTP